MLVQVTKPAAANVTATPKAGKANEVSKPTDVASSLQSKDKAAAAAKPPQCPVAPAAPPQSKAVKSGGQASQPASGNKPPSPKLAPPQRLQTKPTDKRPEKAPDKASEKASEQASEKPSKKPPEKPSGKPPETLSQAPASQEPSQPTKKGTNPPQSAPIKPLQEPVKTNMPPTAVSLPATLQVQPPGPKVAASAPKIVPGTVQQAPLIPEEKPPVTSVASMEQGSLPTIMFPHPAPSLSVLPANASFQPPAKYGSDTLLSTLQGPLAEEMYDSHSSRRNSRLDRIQRESWNDINLFSRSSSYLGDMQRPQRREELTEEYTISEMPQGSSTVCPAEPAFSMQEPKTVSSVPLVQPIIQPLFSLYGGYSAPYGANYGYPPVGTFAFGPSYPSYHAGPFYPGCFPRPPLGYYPGMFPGGTSTLLPIWKPSPTVIKPTLKRQRTPDASELESDWSGPDAEDLARPLKQVASAQKMIGAPKESSKAMTDTTKNKNLSAAEVAEASKSSNNSQAGKMISMERKKGPGDKGAAKKSDTGKDEAKAATAKDRSASKETKENKEVTKKTNSPQEVAKKDS